MKHLIQFVYNYPKGCKHSSLPADYKPTETFQTSEFYFSDFSPQVGQLQDFDGQFWQINSGATYAPKLLEASKTQRFHIATCSQLGESFEPIAQTGEPAILCVPVMRSGRFPRNDDGSHPSIWVNDPDHAPRVGGWPQTDDPLIVDEVQWFEPLNGNSLHIYQQVAICWCVDASPLLVG